MQQPSHHYQPKNILVTGGAGFIGSNFIHHLLAQMPAITIVNLDKLTYAGSLNNLKNLPHTSHHYFIQGDICDKVLVEKMLRDYTIDTIIHFAAESHVDRSIHQPNAFIETNIIGTGMLLAAARECWQIEKKYHAEQCRFHHISTDEVFGSLTNEDSPRTENAPYMPRSPYAASKASADHLVQAYFHTYSLPITRSYCSNNYGPRQHTEKFIPTIIQAALTKAPIPVYGNGKNIREWLYVEDHCRGILKIIQHGKIGESYNIGSEDAWENIALTHYLCEKLDQLIPHTHPHAARIQSVADRLGHDFRYALDTTKIRKELSWQPEITFKDGIDKTLRSYL